VVSMVVPGWRHDPTGRHAYRYHDGTMWTAKVADVDWSGVDPDGTRSLRTFATGVQGVGPALTGWWPDPYGQHRARYHSGTGWTGKVVDSGGGPTSERPTLQDRWKDSVQQVSDWSNRQLSGAARWMHHRTSRDRPSEISLLSQQPRDDPVLGQWSGLAGAIASYAFAAGGMTGGGDLLGVLRAISGTDRAQNRLLDSIDAKVDALVKGPFNAGRTQLHEAERIGSDRKRQLKHIRRAKDYFYLAHGQAASVQSRALVEYHLGLTWLLLKRTDDAVHWLEQSHASSMTVVNELAHHMHNMRVLRSQGGTATAATFYPAGLVVLGMKFRKMVAAERAREMLRDFLPFVYCVARSYNCLVLDADVHLPALEMVATGPSSYDLRPITPDP
jgi:hypothetical protein